MGIVEDIEDMKKEVNDIKEKSFASEIIEDYKKQNKRLFITLILVILLWFITGGYLIYILNDIRTEITTEETIDIDDVNNIQDSHIHN